MNNELARFAKGSDVWATKQANSAPTNYSTDTKSNQGSVDNLGQNSAIAEHGFSALHFKQCISFEHF